MPPSPSHALDITSGGCIAIAAHNQVHLHKVWMVLVRVNKKKDGEMSTLHLYQSQLAGG
jgi:hypothetical protein